LEVAGPAPIPHERASDIHERTNDFAEHYISFVEFADPAQFANVDVYAEKGSGIDTVVGSGSTHSRQGNCSTPRRGSSHATATSTRKT
jgi:hypothetical protein